MFFSPNQWRYVPTKVNPADHLTRGVKLSELTKLKTWWEGPDYLCKNQEFWPKNELPMCAVEEVKKKYVRMTELQEAPGALEVILYWSSKLS